MPDLEKKKGELASIEKAKKYLPELLKEIDKLNKKLQLSIAKLQIDLEELNRLEKMQIRTLFKKVLVDREKQKETKRQEYLQSFLEYKEVKNYLEVLSYEKSIIETKINTESQVKYELEKLEKEKEKKDLVSGLQRAKTLNKLNANIGELLKIKREFLEVILVGKMAKMYFQQLTDWLQQASRLRDFSFGTKKSDDYDREKSLVDKAMTIFYKLLPSLQ